MRAQVRLHFALQTEEALNDILGRLAAAHRDWLQGGQVPLLTTEECEDFAFGERP